MDLNDDARARTDDEFRAKMDSASSYRPKDDVEPLVNLADASVRTWLHTPPPARQWLLRDILPLGVVGLLGAGGGTGKSMLLLQLAVAVATGREFLGIEIGEPGGALILAAEDERDELHRRLWRIIEDLRRTTDFGPYDEALLCERLFIASRVGADNRLTRLDPNRDLIRTDIGPRIAATANLMAPCRLIVPDPVSRYRGGEENSNDDATRFVEAVETLRADTGATVLMPHHMTKDGLRAGAERLSAEMLRGASGLLDGVRWAAAMATLSRDAAKTFAINPDDAGRYARLDIVKNNYAPPWPGTWLERTRDGVLAPCDLQHRPKTRQAEDKYAEVLPKLIDLVRRREEARKPLTRRQLRQYAGKEGIFGIGEKSLDAIVTRAIEERQIREHDTGNKRTGVELHTFH